MRYGFLHNSESVKRARNIDNGIALKLTEIGVHTLSDLRVLGAVEAYLRIRERFSERIIRKGYYLFCLEGAILNINWRDISINRKRELLEQVYRYQ